MNGDDANGEIACCAISGAEIEWLLAALIGMVLTLLAIAAFKKFNIRVARLRPQIFVVVVGLVLIAIIALLINQHNVTSIAVGGLIALTMRIIEKDSGDSPSEPDGGDNGGPQSD